MKTLLNPQQLRPALQTGLRDRTVNLDEVIDGDVNIDAVDYGITAAAGADRSAAASEPQERSRFLCNACLRTCSRTRILFDGGRR
jgi:hypothetical protein